MNKNEQNGQSHETIFNLALGAALALTSERWQSDANNMIRVEQTGVIQGESNKLERPDILLLDSEFPPVVIESSFCGLHADKDAVARLGLVPQRSLVPIRTVVALRIPDHFRYRDQSQAFEHLRTFGEIDFAIHQVVSEGTNADSHSCDRRRWPKNGFINGNIYDLSELIHGVALPKEELERLATEIAKLIDEAAVCIKHNLTDAETVVLRDEIFQRTPLSPLRTCMVVWFNALVLQHRLAKLGVKGANALKLSDLTCASASPQTYLNSLLALYKTNWSSLLQPAIRTLQSLVNRVPRESAQALHLLVIGVKRMEAARVGLHINFGAELFPKLTEDQKEAAGFYTRAASAELLSTLAIQFYDLPEIEWKSASVFKHHSLADLACGTGTLLRAGFRRVASIHKRLCNSDSQLNQLHIDAMAHGLIGTDINPIAAHLTASSLASLGNGLPDRKTRIGWLGIGGTDNSIGSLEFLQQNEVFNQMQVISLSRRSYGNDSNKSAIRVLNDQLDWMLMNPPHSRPRGGQRAFDVAGLSESEKRACRARWKRLVKNEPVTLTAGMAASFLALANKKVKPGGRIGFVLPLTAAFAESWRKTRKMIERDFENVLIVTHSAGRALDREALSADTHMEEMLLVATRRKVKTDSDVDSNIVCATLREPTVRCGEASEIARSIEMSVSRLLERGVRRMPISLGEDELGTLGIFESRNQGDPWGDVGVTSRVDLV